MGLDGCHRIRSNLIAGFMRQDSPRASSSGEKHITVWNRGIGGNNTADGIARFDKDVLAFAPQHLVIGFGGNDAVYHGVKTLPLATYRQNFQSMIDRALAHGVRNIVVVTPPPMIERYVRARHPDHPAVNLAAHVLQFEEAACEIAARNKLPLANLRLLIEKHGGATEETTSLIRNIANCDAPDGLHLMPEGYRLLAELIASLLANRVAAGESVVCFGDSLTYGVHVRGAGTAKGETYPAWLWLLLNQQAGLTTLRTPPDSHHADHNGAAEPDEFTWRTVGDEINGPPPRGETSDPVTVINGDFNLDANTAGITTAKVRYVLEVQTPPPLADGFTSTATVIVKLNNSGIAQGAGSELASPGWHEIEINPFLLRPGVNTITVGLKKALSETLRPIQETDYALIGGIVRKIWGAGGDALLEARYGQIGGKPWQEWISDRIVQELRHDPAKVIVAQVEGHVAGFASYSVDAERKIGTVGYNGVDPIFGGRGIGGRMLQETLRRIRAEGMSIAQVVTGLNEGHAPARKMYEKAGFAPLVQSIAYSMRLPD